MMLKALPPLIEPETWMLAFHRTSPWWWVRLLAFGRYKHVSAFAWIAPCGMWLYYDVRLAGTQIALLPDSSRATSWLMAQTADADLVRVRRRASGFPPIAAFYCVPAIKHLIGLRCGALRPDRLYRDVLAHGGELIDGRPASTAADTQPGAVAAARAGQY